MATPRNCLLPVALAATACTAPDAVTTANAAAPAPATPATPATPVVAPPAPVPAVPPVSATPPTQPVPEDISLRDRLHTASIPPELQAGGEAAAIWRTHAIDFGINPFYLRGDFDGDRKPDHVVGLRSLDDRSTPPNVRMLVLWGKPGAAATWLDDDEGAGFTTPARDWWHVHAASARVPVGLDETRPKLVGDAIVLGKLESSSALLYWDGKRFRSHWLSD